MTKKQRAAIIIERLREAYPDATCTLEYDEAWKLLVEVRLAAQCTECQSEYCRAGSVCEISDSGSTC